MTVYCKSGSKIEAYAKKRQITYKNNGVARKVQKITAKSITKTYSTKTFFINAKTNGGGKLTYSIDDKKVAT